MRRLLRLLTGACAALLGLHALPPSCSKRRRVGPGDRQCRLQGRAAAEPGERCHGRGRGVRSKLGFDKVILRRNLGAEAFRAALLEMSREAAGAELGVVYFAGHGTEVAGRNFLIPVDARLAKAGDSSLEAIALDTVLEQLAGVTRLKLVILDACRNNLFPVAGARRSVTRGLSPHRARGQHARGLRGQGRHHGRGRRGPQAQPVHRGAAEAHRHARAGDQLRVPPRARRRGGGDQAPSSSRTSTARWAARNSTSSRWRHRRLRRPLRCCTPRAEVAEVWPRGARTPEPCRAGGVPRDPTAARPWHSARGADRRTEEARQAAPPVPKRQPPPPVAPAPPKADPGRRWACLRPRGRPCPHAGRGARPQARRQLQDCDVCPEMVVVPAGSFMMGSPAGEAGRSTRTKARSVG